MNISSSRVLEKLCLGDRRMHLAKMHNPDSVSIYSYKFD